MPVSVKAAPVTISAWPGRPPPAASPALTSSLAEIGRAQAAVIREESRFDRNALSPAAARGLTQLTLPTALRVAAQIDVGKISPEDLYRPEVSVALGAAYLGTLLKELQGSDFLAVAAYNAGEPQARLWRSYAYSPEMEELFSKIGFRETRSYLRRVLTSRAHYAELY